MCFQQFLSFEEKTGEKIFRSFGRLFCIHYEKVSVSINCESLNVALLNSFPFIVNHDGKTHVHKHLMNIVLLMARHPPTHMVIDRFPQSREQEMCMNIQHGWEELFTDW